MPWFPRQETLQAEAPRIEPSLQEFPGTMSPTPIPSRGQPRARPLIRSRFAKRPRAPRAAIRDRRQALPHELPSLIFQARQQTRAEPPANELLARLRPGEPLPSGSPAAATTRPTRPTNPLRGQLISPEPEHS